VGNILIIGGDSLVGGALSSRFRQSGAVVTTTTRRKRNVSTSTVFLDLSDPKTFQFSKNAYDNVIFCAGVTSLALCEANSYESEIVNVSNTLELMKILDNGKTHFVILSTNLVFDGSRELHTMSETPNPQTVYGRQKALLELMVMKQGCNAAIVRLTKVIQPHHPLFGNWLCALLNNKEIYPFMDRLISPVSLDFVTSIILRIAEILVPGIFHCSSNKSISYFEAATYIAKAAGLRTDLIRPICHSSLSSDQIQFASLSDERLSEIGFKQPSPEEALKSTITEFHQRLAGC
jgi:dTDP-4-dehydrorhamnose reductase